MCWRYNPSLHVVHDEQFLKDLPRAHRAYLPESLGLTREQLRDIGKRERLGGRR